MLTTTTCAIAARDFDVPGATPAQRNRWHVGKLRHTIAALEGAPVALVVDRSSGHTLLGVVLERVTAGGAVEVRATYSEGLPGDPRIGQDVTRYPIRDLGLTIVPLGLTAGAPRDAKWTALETWRLEMRAAIEVAQARRPDLLTGSWSAEPGLEVVTVTVADRVTGRHEYLNVDLEDFAPVRA